MEVDQVLPLDEAVDPDQVAALVAHPLGEACHLGRNLRRVRTAGDDDQLMPWIQLEGRGQKQRQSLLACDAAVEERERPVRIDAKTSQRLGRRLRSVDLGIDAVVDHVHPVGVNLRIAGQHVVAYAFGDRYDTVGGFDGGPLAEHRKRVAAAELLGLPRPQRLQAVDRHDVRNGPHELGNVPAQIRVPRVAVHHVDTLDGPRHGEVDGHRLQRRGFGLRFRDGIPGLMACHSGLVAGSAPAVNRDLGQVAELSRDVLDGGARAPVDFGWIFAGQDRDLAYGATWTFKPLPERNASIAAKYSSSPNRLVIMASQSITPLTSSLSARSKLWTTAIEPMILISSL